MAKLKRDNRFVRKYDVLPVYGVTRRDVYCVEGHGPLAHHMKACSLGHPLAPRTCLCIAGHSIGPGERVYATPERHTVCERHAQTFVLA